MWRFPLGIGMTSGQTADGKHDFISQAMPVSVGWHF
jgi:hypothetical protein